MGVDTSIEVVLPHEPKREQVIEWTWRIREALRIRADDKYPQFVVNGDEPTVLVFYSLWRWYSDSYERGPWPDIYAAVRWCMANFPDANVYLYPDSSDRESESPITIEEMDKTWKHWAVHGGIPYHGRERGEVVCCGGQIFVNGSRGLDRFGYCPSCGKRYTCVGGVWTLDVSLTH